jgi:homoaconitase/3-isopropylmalate dehydratase large subunit
MQDAYAYAYAGSKQCSNAHMADRHQTKNFKDGVVHVVNLNNLKESKNRIKTGSDSHSKTSLAESPRG